MKNKIYILIIMLFCSAVTNTQAQVWKWAKDDGTIGGGPDGGYIAIDANGNSYATGVFWSNTAKFGDSILTNAYGGQNDIYIVKHDANGNVLWAKSAGGTGSEYVHGISVDANGNSYITGYFESPTMNFGNNISLTNNGYCLFVAKYDPSGTVLWAKTTVEPGAIGLSIDVDALGNSYVSGQDMSPTLTFGHITLTNTSNCSDGFIVKFNSSGDVIWAKNSKGIGYNYNGTFASCIKLDLKGHLFLGGSFFGKNITLESDTLKNIDTSGKSRNYFIAKYDTSGKELWAKNAGSSTNTLPYNPCYSMDINGNFYTTGEFNNASVTFGNTTLTNPHNGSYNAFIVKFDSTGKMIFCKNAKLSNAGPQHYNIYLRGITSDDKGNSYITGDFECQVIKFDNFSLTNSDQQYYGTDLYVVEFDATGQVVWAIKAGESGGSVPEDIGLMIGIDIGRNVYIGGNFGCNPINFGSTSLHNVSGKDFFIAKLGDIPTGVGGENKPLNSLAVYPNPCTTCEISGVTDATDIIVTDLLGKTLNASFTKTSGGFNIQLTNAAAGIYFVKNIKTGEAGKFVKE